ITTDSRKIQGRELFIPLIGERFDGHDFVLEAVSQGVEAVLIQKMPCENISMFKDTSIILVEDTLKALQDLAKYYKGFFKIPIVAVTGSTGKTSTKDMIYSVLMQRYCVMKSEGNFNNHIGLPLSIFNLKKEHEVAIFEMGMSSLGEIDTLAEIARPNISVITNIGLSHIEHLGSQENILKAKMEITNYLQKEDLLILNGDDVYLKTIKEQKDSFKKYLVGLESNNDLRPTNIQDFGELGSSFDIFWRGVNHSFQLKVPGVHNIHNALSAIAVGVALEMNMMEIQKGIEAYLGSEMRLNIFMTSEEIKVINDAYNASPDSMKAAISVLSKSAAQRKIAVLGDMAEMGSFSKMGHKTVGYEISKEPIDLLIVVGNMSRFIAEGAVEKGFEQGKVSSFKNNQEAIEYLDKVLMPQDMVLVKGSRSMKMEEIVIFLQERR
ncbi:MAG: UDP-N-acetylmuramoyl-tripeptide--D-alanyl-D-alanine ligase, partial [Thermotaleaceae bacterium]